MSAVVDDQPELVLLTASDLQEALALWQTAEGVVLRDEDRSPQAFEAFLARNPGLSWGVRRGGRLVGAVLAGQDGRRGYIYHLAVADDCRRCGVGRMLVERMERELIALGIRKAHAYVVNRNLRAQLFWKKVGWISRDEIVLFSRNFPPAP
ncbi:MAG: GNAT family N-acetyltransferase [Nevskia sp.]|nr:GNAT family N-acetyltransferase [Nevskia sp.]